MDGKIGYWNDFEARVQKNASKNYEYTLNNEHERASSSLIELNKMINNVSYDLEKILNNLKSLERKYNGDDDYLISSIKRDVNNFLNGEVKDMKYASIRLNEALNEGIENISNKKQLLEDLSKGMEVE